jgi:hypothetical protein
VITFKSGDRLEEREGENTLTFVHVAPGGEDCCALGVRTDEPLWMDEAFQPKIRRELLHAFRLTHPEFDAEVTPLIEALETDDEEEA